MVYNLAMWFKKNEKTSDINQKMRYRYNCTKQDLKELENDTTATLHSQYDALAKGTSEGISNMPRLKNAMLEEADLLSDASENFARLSLKTSEQADELRTRVKEAEKVEKRMSKKIRVLPVKPTNAEIDYEEKVTKHFAAGAAFFKLFWFFFIGCFGGVVIETIWCIITRGHYESRVGLIYGPFNLVYGFGALVLTYCLYKYRNRSAMYSFIGGFISGSVVEYLCSFFQEMAFGSTSWDYSSMPYNLNGRICLKYSIFWGILGVFWIKTLYPIMATWILKIPNKIGRPLTKILLVFMIFNSFMSGATVFRWYERTQNKPSTNVFTTYIDKHYPNERMEKIYANLEFKKQ